MSIIKTNTLSTLDGSYSVPSETLARGACRAWVNFNGTGTVAIRASFNVSSITDNGTGDYTINFTTAMPDANYAVSGFIRPSVGVNAGVISVKQNVAPTVSGVTLLAVNTAYTGTVDHPEVYVAIFR